jgi:excinuclease ABC subunit C
METFTPVEGIQQKLSGVPADPGVYLMKDAQGEVIYVGKARNLRKRLATYFKAAGHADMKTGVLVNQLSDFDTIVTRSEKEALILESNLIKRHRPRYNVVLKDDKRYPSLRLDMSETYPNFQIVRKIKNDGGLYFGPFASAYAVRQTLKIINKTFKLRKCRAREFKRRIRPCLHCQMQGCLAPCCLDVDPQLYREMVNEAVMFLKGRAPDLVRKIRTDMEQAAGAQDFERAARLRDKMFSIEKTIEKQVAVTTDFRDRDVLAVTRSDHLTLITMLVVRSGFLTGTRHFGFGDTISTEGEILGTFIRQLYERAHDIPNEILVSDALEDADLLEDWLQKFKGQKVKIIRPQRGNKSELIRLALQNSAKELKDRLASLSRERDILVRLQKRLRMDRLPQRIECMDNSNTSGMETVAGLVVFQDGQADPSRYRTYRIKGVQGPDDYAAMAEIMQRRFGKGEDSKPYPDLLMIDGGKGQLNIAVSVLRELHMDSRFHVVSIAKKDEKKGETQDKIFQPGRVNAIGFGKELDLLLFLQRVRDEAHRFAISFHRRRRSRSSLRSAFDSMPGVGKKRKVALLKHFKTIDAIRAASVDEISALPGFNRGLAETVHRELDR